MEKSYYKNQARLYTKLSSFVAECEKLYGMKTVYHDRISIHTLKRLKKQLCRIKVQEEFLTFTLERKKRPIISGQSLILIILQRYQHFRGCHQMCCIYQHRCLIKTNTATVYHLQQIVHYTILWQHLL